MSRPRVEIRMPPRSAFDKFERETEARIEAAALNATHMAAGRAKTLIRREMSVQPTIKIRPGYRYNVLVNRDLIFEGPYLNTFVGGGLVP